MQQAGDYQVALMFLLDLDWKIASDWQQVRDREKTLKELKKAVGAEVFGNFRYCPNFRLIKYLPIS